MVHKTGKSPPSHATWGADCSQASRFLIKMAEEIEAVQSPNVPDFEGRKSDDGFPLFEPMRRKLPILVEP